MANSIGRISKGPLRAGIVEDERHSLDTLQRLLALQCPEVEVVFAASSVAEARTALDQDAIDLLFLDIEMPGGSGFDLLEGLEQIDFEIVFTTSHADYAIHAIKFYALDYLLKPIGMEELGEAVGRVHGKKERMARPEVVDAMKGWILPGAPRDTKMAFPVRDGLMFLHLADIIRCASDGRYTWIFLQNGQKHLISRHLKEFEILLAPYGFARIHQLHLINLYHVERYQKGEGGIVTLTGGTEVEVARRRKKAFLDRLARL